VDVPEMGYLSTDKPPRGEIWINGPNVFSGYHKNEEATREALDEKGWLRTGDVGRWNPNGTLSVIDRKKNIFKLSQGEYIAAEKIESVYGKSDLVAQIWVYGNSFKSFCLAVVVPNAERIASICQEKGWWPTAKDATVVGNAKFIEDFNAVFTGSHAAELKQLVVASMRSQEGPLKGFEKVTDIIIESRIDGTLAGFTEANECLTPTFKIRRPYLLVRYMPTLKALYAKHDEPDKPDEKWPGEK
jgi:long-chain acyl-CoA synthetase